MLGTPPKIEEHTNVGLIDEAKEIAIQVIGEFAVMIEPPERALRNEQELRPAFLQVLQVRDSRIRVGGVIAGVDAALPLRKVRSAARIEAEQVVISPADCKHVPALWNGLANQVTNLLQHLPILQILAGFVSVRAFRRIRRGGGF